MTKRSKLNLSAPQENVRKRPAGFKVPPSTARRTGATIRAKQPAKPAAPPPAQTESSKEIQKERATWLTVATLAKTMLVVGAAALAILLLKRRIF